MDYHRAKQVSEPDFATITVPCSKSLPQNKWPQNPLTHSFPGQVHLVYAAILRDASPSVWGGGGSAGSVFRSDCEGRR